MHRRYLFPTAFTPNNDGKNDLFKPIVYTSLTRYYFVVYDRLGQKVFEQTDPLKGWNGTINSHMQNSGT